MTKSYLTIPFLPTMYNLLIVSSWIATKSTPCSYFYKNVHKEQWKLISWLQYLKEQVTRGPNRVRASATGYHLLDSASVTGISGWVVVVADDDFCCGMTSPSSPRTIDHRRISSRGRFIAIFFPFPIFIFLH